MNNNLKLEFTLLKEEIIGPYKLVLLKAKTMYLLDLCNAEEDASTIIYKSTDMAKYLRGTDREALSEFDRTMNVVINKLPLVEYTDYPDEIKEIMDEWRSRLEKSEIIFPFIRGDKLDFIYKNMHYVIYPEHSKGSAAHIIYFDYIYSKLLELGVTHICLDRGFLD